MFAKWWFSNLLFYSLYWKDILFLLLIYSFHIYFYKYGFIAFILFCGLDNLLLLLFILMLKFLDCVFRIRMLLVA